MLYPRGFAKSVGGYDPGFSPVWFDDVDLSLSARREGLKVFFLSGVEFVHRIGLRNDRRETSGSLQVRKRVRRAVGSLIPPSLKDAVVRAERRGTDHPPHELKRLRHHCDYWREKWGFDLLNPDMAQVLERYGSTEVCWAYDPVRRADGERIIEAWS